MAMLLLSPHTARAQEQAVTPAAGCTVTDSLRQGESHKAKNPRRHRKTLRQLLGTADSLRLQLRYAADHGYMLQWADTLLRQRLRHGEIDSARYARLTRRLARIDRQLFRGDSLLARNYRKKNIDTAYITRPDARWTIKLRTNISSSKLHIITTAGDERRDMEAQSEFRGTVSVAVAYRGLGLGVALNPAKLAGKSKDFEFNLNSYGNKFGFDVVYLSSKTYKGTQTIGDVRTDVGKGLISMDGLNLNAYYALNGKRFSFPAAFSQSYIQRRSAGSWMIGASLDVSRTRTTADEQTGTTDMKIDICDFALGAGYAYNWVPSRHWLLHLSALPTYTVFARDKMTSDGEHYSMSHVLMSGIITGRGAAVYSWRNKFVGATMVYNYSFAGNKDHLQVQRDKWRVRAFFGFRF